MLYDGVVHSDAFFGVDLGREEVFGATSYSKLRKRHITRIPRQIGATILITHLALNPTSPPPLLSLKLQLRLDLSLPQSPRIGTQTEQLRRNHLMLEGGTHLAQIFLFALMRLEERVLLFCFLFQFELPVDVDAGLFIEAQYF